VQNEEIYTRLTRILKLAGVIFFAIYGEISAWISVRIRTNMYVFRVQKVYFKGKK